MVKIVYYMDSSSHISSSEQKSVISADRNSAADAAFVRAVRNGDLKDIADSLADGADINQTAFKHEATALVYLSRARNAEHLLRFLLVNYKPDLAATDADGDSALSEAAYNGHIKNAKALLQAGVDPAIKNKRGKTAAERAIDKGHDNIAQLILDAMIEAVSYNGFTKENEYTVSRRENFETSNISLVQAFNFASKEVITVGKGRLFIQSFKDIEDQTRIEKAAEALKELKGNPGDWQRYKPVTPVKGRRK